MGEARQRSGSAVRGEVEVGEVMPVLPTLPVDRLGPIPDVVHQIWVGSEPPAWVRRFWAGWDEFAAEHHPTLTMRRWTDDDLDGTATGRISRRHQGLAPVVIADLLRVEAVSSEERRVGRACGRGA